MSDYRIKRVSKLMRDACTAHLLKLVFSHLIFIEYIWWNINELHHPRYSSFNFVLSLFYLQIYPLLIWNLWVFYAENLIFGKVLFFLYDLVERICLFEIFIVGACRTLKFVLECWFISVFMFLWSLQNLFFKEATFIYKIWFFLLVKFANGDQLFGKLIQKRLLLCFFYELENFCPLNFCVKLWDERVICVKSFLLREYDRWLLTIVKYILKVIFPTQNL